MRFARGAAVGELHSISSFGNTVARAAPINVVQLIMVGLKKKHVESKDGEDAANTVSCQRVISRGFLQTLFEV